MTEVEAELDTAHDVAAAETAAPQQQEDTLEAGKGEIDDVLSEPDLVRYIHTAHSILPSFLYNVHKKDAVTSLAPTSLKTISFAMIFLWATFACVYITPTSLGIIVLATCSCIFFIRLQSWSLQGTTKFAEALAIIQRGAFVAAQVESATTLKLSDMQADLNKLAQKVRVRYKQRRKTSYNTRCGKECWSSTCY